jgi:hypothetical protein
MLNRHRRGLLPWRCQLSISLSPLFPTDDPPLSPKGPARSQVNILKTMVASLAMVVAAHDGDAKAREATAR